MQEQEKREPGRPRKATTKQRIDITLSAEVLRFLDDRSESRSKCIETAIRALPEFAEWQNWDRHNKTPLGVEIRVDPGQWRANDVN